jgi:hypothetical protein
LSGFIRRPHSQELATADQLPLPVAIAKEAIVADTLEAVGKHVEQEPTDELVGRQGHGFLFAVVAIVFVTELHVAIFDIEQAIVGDGHAVSVATHVVEYLLGPGKGCFGVDNPFRLPQWD